MSGGKDEYGEKPGQAWRALHSPGLAPDDATMMVVKKVLKTNTHTHTHTHIHTRTDTHTHIFSLSFAIHAGAFWQHRRGGRAAHRLRTVTLDTQGKCKTIRRGSPCTSDLVGLLAWGHLARNLFCKVVFSHVGGDTRAQVRQSAFRWKYCWPIGHPSAKLPGIAM